MQSYSLRTPTNRTQLTSAKVLTETEVELLQATLTKHEKTDFRNTTFIWMLLHTGARVSELLKVRPKDLAFEGSTVFIQGLKNGHDREIPLYPWLFNRMKVLSEKLGPDDLVFPFGYHRARNIWALWKPVNKKIHSCRHYRAQQVYRKTKDLKLVQLVLGHKDIGNTMIYLEYDYNQNELRRALL